MARAMNYYLVIGVSALMLLSGTVLYVCTKSMPWSAGKRSDVQTMVSIVHSGQLNRNISTIASGLTTTPFSCGATVPNNTIGVIKQISDKEYFVLDLTNSTSLRISNGMKGYINFQEALKTPGTSCWFVFRNP